MVPDPNFQTIKSERILCADSFLLSLTDDPPNPALVDRIRQFGQTTPLLVWEDQPEHYLLLADYPGYQAISSLKVASVCCRVLAPTAPAVLRFSLSVLHEQAALLPPSPIVQAHLLRQASQQLSRVELLALLPLMGYKPQRHVAEELIALLHLAPAAVHAMHQGILAPKTGKLIKLLSPEDQASLAGLIETYRPGGSKQFKLVEMVTELCLRHNQSIDELLGAWNQAAHRQDNPPQRLQELLHNLAALVWPERIKMEKRFQRFTDAMLLPDGVTLAPSMSFEDESVELRLRFANSDMLQQKWARMKRILQS
jgi:ParB family chromosome partitioning protein